MQFIDSLRSGGKIRGSLQVTARQATNIPIDITLHASQSVDAIRVRNSSGVELFSVDENGNLSVAGSITTVSTETAQNFSVIDDLTVGDSVSITGALSVGTTGSFGGAISAAGVTSTGNLVASGGLYINSITQGSILFAGSGGRITQDNTNLRWDDTNKRLGFLTAAPTHTVTYGSTSTGWAQYNTADQTTNYERIVSSWAANIYSLAYEKGGSGTARAIRFLTNAGASGLQIDSSSGGLSIIGSTGSQATITNLVDALGISILGRITTGTAVPAVRLTNSPTGSSYSASSGTQTGVDVPLTLNQSGTAGFDAFKVALTETATGSGTKNLFLGTVGGTNRWRVDDSGNEVISSAATSGVTLYNTSDEVTNTERFRLAWVTNVLRMETIAAGSGSARGITIQSGGGANTTIAASNSTLTFNGSGYAGYTGGITTGSTVMFNVTNGSTWSSTSLVQDAFSVTGTVNQASGTGGWRGIVVNPTLTAVGSTGAKLIDLQVASTSKFYVDSSGNVTTTGGVTRAFTSTASTNYTVLATDDILHLTSSSARTVNLPAAASSSGRVIVVKDAAGAAMTGNITVDGNSSETIDGAATYTLNLNYQSATLYCNGTAWFVI